jgi:CheY-like chemotaxis protein
MPITILMADDDPDDRLLTADALKEARLINDIRFVENGMELLEYLRRQGKFASPADAPRPGLILLDLNMPKMDGRTVLKELKSDPNSGPSRSSSSPRRRTTRMFTAAMTSA